MKRLILVISILILSLTTFSQKVFHPFDAYLKRGTEWVRVTETSENVYPDITIYFNNSDDALSMLDRVEITNAWDDIFVFPYKGVQVAEKKVKWKVYDKQGKNLYFTLGFHDDSYGRFMSIKISYSNIEYMYLCRY